MGLEGPVGQRGETGPTGAQGTPAPAGATGPTGARGHQGEAGSVGSYTRTLVTSSIILQASAREFLDLDVDSKSCLIYKIATSFPAWIRVYNTSQARALDADRDISQDADSYLGLIAEVITSDLLPSVSFPIVVLGYNDEDTPSSILPISITNLSSQTREIDINLTILPLEK
jgi:hypothetical protein